jgi:hypothetical protein
MATMVTVALGPFYPKGVIETDGLQSAGIRITSRPKTRFPFKVDVGDPDAAYSGYKLLFYKTVTFLP